MGTDLNIELVDYYIHHLKDIGKSKEATLQNIRRDLEIFIEFWETVNHVHIDSDLVKAFVKSLEDKYSGASILAKVSSLRRFINWLNLKENPFWDKDLISKSLKINRENKNLYYKLEQIKKLINKLQEQNTEDALLDELLIRFIYEFCLTVDELSQLDIGAYNIAGGELVLRGKEISCTKELKSVMKDFMHNSRSGFEQSGIVGINDPLFVNIQGQRLNAKEIRDRLLKYKLKPRYLKLSRVLHLLEAGMPTEHVETMLGIQVSKNIMSLIKEPDYRLLATYKKYHPRA